MRLSVRLSVLTLLCILVMASFGLAVQGVGQFASDFQGAQGTFLMPYDTGPPPAQPHFNPPQQFQPNGGGPPIPVGDEDSAVITIGQPGGRIYHFSIYRDPYIPNLTHVRFHDDLNGNGIVDPGENVSGFADVN